MLPYQNVRSINRAARVLPPLFRIGDHLIRLRDSLRTLRYHSRVVKIVAGL